jgi:hypothetical protein
MLSRLRDESGQWTLIGTMVAIAVGFFILFVVLLPRLTPGRQAEKEGLVKPKEGQTVIGASIDKAKQTACSSNLRQIRMAIDYYKAENGQPPPSLQALKLPTSGTFYTCPATGLPYHYDPNSGTVSCPTPGHQGF